MENEPTKNVNFICDWSIYNFQPQDTHVTIILMNGNMFHQVKGLNSGTVAL